MKKIKKNTDVARNVSVIQDINGNSIVFINDIIFKGKRSIKWDEVEEYLKKYIDDFYMAVDSKDIVYIGKDLPDEYAHSQYTNNLRGYYAKAKANAVQGIPEMIEIAGARKHVPNRKKKHQRTARFG